MKTITHYFSEFSKRNETTTMDCAIEVRRERGKSLPGKRERVKIQIKSASSSSAECKIVENKLDLIDKTPSPLCDGQRIPLRQKDTTLRTKRKLPEEDDDIVVEQTKENIVESREIQKMENSDSENKNTKNTLEKISKSKNKKMTGKANSPKSSMDKKKNRTIDKIEIEEVTPEKKVLRPQESKKDNINNGNITNEQKHSSYSLLNYFSKATPEQIQIEKMAMSKVIVKAEIHQIEEDKLICHINNSLTPQKNKGKQKKKRVSDNNSILSTADEIEIISSENISPPTNTEALKPASDTNSLLSPNVTPKSNKIPRNKPKWSMKIKLNSTLNDNEEGTILPDPNESFDEEIFTPRSAKHAENCDTPRSRKSKCKNEKPKTEHQSTLINSKKSPKSGKSLSPPSLKRKNSQSPKTLKNDVSTKTSPSTTSKTESKLAPIFVRRNSMKNNDDVVLIEESLKRKPTEKLASLFVKRMKPDPEILAARRKFLQPEVVDVNERPKTMVLPPLEFFPKISHVTQLEKISEHDKIKLNFTLKSVDEFKPNLNYSDMKSVNSTSIINSVEECKLNEITDVEAEKYVQEIGLRCENANEIWQRFSKLGKSNEPVQVEIKKKKRGRPKKNGVPANDSFQDSMIEHDTSKDLDWTSKYKPMSSQEVIGNKEAVKKLKEWLNNWKSTDEKKEQSDSEDDLYPSDCSRSSFAGKNYVAILLGPHGCGKTSSIYAVAEELGYRVIEVNASSKRPGKKLLKDLEEATKSHRIRNHGMESFGFGAVKASSEEKSLPKKSLILLDDIDLIFDEDDGFINAAFQLSSNTKRPIAMTCKNTFLQSSRFAPQIARINFEAIPRENALGFLEIVVLAETKCKLPLHIAELLSSTGDLRKALLQLQFLLLSKRVPSTLGIENPRPSMWRETYNRLYRPAIKAAKLNKKKQEKQILNKTNTTILEEISSNIDTLSKMSKLVIRKDVAFEKKEQIVEDSLSLEEKLHSYKFSDTLGSEIYDWIVEKTLKDTNVIESKDVVEMDSMLLKKNLKEGVNIALAQTISTTLDRRATSLDYLPYVRTICRAEELRQNNNMKRSNRFYHYLQSIVTLRPHSFTAACKVFQEKSKDKSQ